jgi:heme/copper-type cytochrome/quinol oxidase subunit 3
VTEVLAKPLPVGPYDRRGNSWWGVMCLIATEGSLFAYLLFSYYYFDFQLPSSWRPDEHPKFLLSAPDSVILLISSVFVWLGERAIKRGNRAGASLGLFSGAALGIIFILVQFKEWADKHFTPGSSPYGSIYFTTTGFHMAHVTAGVIALLFVGVWNQLGYFDRERHAAIANAAIYWHFVDAVWVTIFFTFYITPYLW